LEIKYEYKNKSVYEPLKARQLLYALNIQTFYFLPTIWTYFTFMVLKTKVPSLVHLSFF